MNNDVQEAEFTAEIASDISDLPESYDLRDYGRVTSVKDQGATEMCWAFSAMGAMESNYLTQGLNTPECGTIPNLSVMHHAWFVYKDPREGCSFKTEANKDILLQGGNSQKSIAFLSRLAGPVNEETLPLPSDFNPYTKPSNTPTDYKRVLRLKEAYYFQVQESSDNNDYIVDPITNDSCKDVIKRTVMKHGAVEINILYNNAKEYYYDNSGKGVSHRVLVVGWDDTLSRDNFSSDETKRPLNNGAWLIKDSHGKNSHKDGYFWMSYEQVIKLAAAYIVAPLDEDLIHYGYDDLGYKDIKDIKEDSDALSTTGTTWVANVFQAKNNELIKEIGFYTLEHRTLEHGSIYEVFIYDLGTEQPSSPTDGNIIAQVGNKNYEIRGYHSVELDAPVKIEAEHYFSVVLKVASSLKHPIAFERADGCIIHKGESYFSTDGSAWIDLEDKNLSPFKANACIKAFTTKLPIDANDENGDLIPFDKYEVVNSTNTKWDAPNAYAVTSNVTISERINVSGGTVQLVLCDGCTLTAEKGIGVSEGSLLVIRGQKQGTGTLKATSDNSYAAIGGSGNITILGGTIVAEAKHSGAGIGGDAYGKVGEIIILGGNITAKSTKNGISMGGGAGIGGGYHSPGGKIIIKGGTIRADCSSNGKTYYEGARGIGGGRFGSGCDITLIGAVLPQIPELVILIFISTAEH